MQIRTLTAADVPSCQALSDDRGWLRNDARWALLVELGEVFGVDDPDGGLAGAVVLTRYGPTYAAIGMMLVAARRERRGLGRRLMSHALERAGCVVSLYATDNGRPLYEKLGFTAIGASTSHFGQLPYAAPTTRPASAADLPGILAHDLAAFGVDRARLLRALPDPGRIRVAPGGYGAAWRNGGITVIGPVVADDTDTARALITDLAVGQQTVRLDITTDHPELAAWAARHLTTGETTTVMSHGGPPPGDSARLFTPFSVATG